MITPSVPIYHISIWNIWQPFWWELCYQIWYWHTAFAIPFIPKLCCYAKTLENQCWKDSAVLAEGRCQEKGLYLLKRETTCWALFHFITFLVHTAHHTLQKCKRENVKTKVSNWKCERESVKLYLLKRETTCWAILHFITFLVYTAHHTLQKYESESVKLYLLLMQTTCWTLLHTSHDKMHIKQKSVNVDV